jgi:hypothetical protein
MNQVDDVNLSFDAQDDRAVPQSGRIVRDDDQELSPPTVTEWVDGIISPFEMSDNDSIGSEPSVYDHIEERARGTQRTYVLSIVTALWGFTMIWPMVVPIFSQEMRELTPMPAYKEMVFRTQCLMTTMFNLFILLYYFQNPELLKAIEKVAKEIVKQSKE